MNVSTASFKYLSTNTLTMYLAVEKSWDDDAGSVPLVVCGNGGNLRCVAESKVYVQSGPTRKAILDHRLSSAEEEYNSTPPPPAPKASSAGRNIRRPKVPLRTHAGSSVRNTHPPKRPRPSTDEDDTPAPPRRTFTSAQRTGEVISRSAHSHPEHVPLRTTIAQSQKAVAQPIAHAPPHPPSQNTQGMGTVRSQIQLGTSSQTVMQPVYNPSGASTSTQPYQMQGFMAMPPVVENVRHRVPSHPHRQRATSTFSNFRHQIARPTGNMNRGAPVYRGVKPHRAQVRQQPLHSQWAIEEHAGFTDGDFTRGDFDGDFANGDFPDMNIDEGMDDDTSYYARSGYSDAGYGNQY
jgi:hypothetical protein